MAGEKAPEPEIAEIGPIVRASVKTKAGLIFHIEESDDGLELVITVPKDAEIGATWFGKRGIIIHQQGMAMMGGVN